MKIYWSCSLHSAPELAGLPYRDRRRLLWECWGKVMWRWPVLLVWFVFLPAMLYGSMFLVAYLALGVGLGWPLALVLGIIQIGPTIPPSIFCGEPSASPIGRRKWRSQLRMVMASKPPPIR